MGGRGHEALDGEVVEPGFEASSGGAAEDDLGDALGGDKRGGGVGDGAVFEADDAGSEIFREAEVGGEGALTIFGWGVVAVDVEDDEFGSEGLGDSGSAGDEVARVGAGADADGDFFADAPLAAETFAGDVGVEVAVDGAGDLLESHLAEGDEVAATEEVGEGALDAVLGVDVAAPHAGFEGFGGDVGEDDLVGLIEDPIGDGLADGDAGERLDAGGEGFDVLDVDGDEDVDAGIEEVDDILVALVVAAALDVGVCELVDEDDFGMAGEDGFEVHLFEEGALVFDVAAGEGGEGFGDLDGTGAAVGFDDADDDVFATGQATGAFAQHAEGLAHAGGVPEEDLQAATLLFRGRYVFEPLLRSFRWGGGGWLLLGHGYNRLVTSRVTRVTLRWVSAVLMLAGLVAFYSRVLHGNPTTVALTLLLYILLLAARWGLRFAVVMSLAATGCFNFFFLPPIGKFTIADSQNWVALFAFLATALIGSNLANRIKDEAFASDARRRELELLYDFGQRLLSTESTGDLMKAIPHDIVSSFRTRAAALYLTQGDRLYLSNAKEVQATREQLRNGVYAGTLYKAQAALLPVSVGVRPIGAISVEGNLPSQETLEAMSSLVAIAIESATAVEKLARADAAHESERLRSALLDSVTHELLTPLSTIRAAVARLIGSAVSVEERDGLLHAIQEESGRLDHLVAQATEMARLDARAVELELAPLSMMECFQEALGLVPVGERIVEVRVAEKLPEVMADRVMIVKVLVHLIENAVRYSPPGAPIFLTAEEDGREVAVSVADRGEGIDAMEQAMVFDKFYRGRGQRDRVRGTGMGLAISKAIVEAHGGTIQVTSQMQSGSVFTMMLPAAR